MIDIDSSVLVKELVSRHTKAIEQNNYAAALALRDVLIFILPREYREVYDCIINNEMRTFDAEIIGDFTSLYKRIARIRLDTLAELGLIRKDSFYGVYESIAVWEYGLEANS